MPSVTAKFAHEGTFTKAGSSFTFIKTPECIERMNVCFGYGNWTFDVVESFRDGEYIVCLGRLSIKNDAGEWVSYMQYGGQSINRKKAKNDGTPGDIVDLADDYKGAASDAMKKAATHFGLGLYLALDRNPTPWSPQSAGVSDPPAAPPESSVDPTESSPPGHNSGGTSSRTVPDPGGHGSGTGVSDGSGATQVVTDGSTEDVAGQPSAAVSDGKSARPERHPESTASVTSSGGDGSRGSLSSSPDALDKLTMDGWNERLNAAPIEIRAKWMAARRRVNLQLKDAESIKQAHDLLDAIEANEGVAV